MTSNKLKEYRLKKQLTQIEVAENIGVSVDYISMLERGLRTPGFALSKKLAEFYGTTIEDLFFNNKSN